MTRPLLRDGLWAEIAPVLPPESAKPKGDRQQISDRVALSGILFVLRQGAPWELVPRGNGPRLEHALLATLARLAEGQGGYACNGC